MFEEAKTKINVNEKAHVVAGFLSPSHDSYVNHKLHNTDFESGYHRAKMIELAVKNSSWLSVHRWEISQSMFVDFPYVIRAIAEYIKKKYKATPFANIQVSYLCGADHAERCELGSLKIYGVIIMARPGSEKAKQWYGKSEWAVIVDSNADIASSTLVRKRINTGEPIEDLVGVDVANYIKENDLFGMKKIKK